MFKLIIKNKINTIKEEYFCLRIQFYSPPIWEQIKIIILHQNKNKPLKMFCCTLFRLQVKTTATFESIIATENVPRHNRSPAL